MVLAIALPPPLKALSLSTAVATCTALTVLFFGSFYLLPKNDPSRTTPPSRNDPAVVRARFISVGLSCVLSLGGVAFLLHGGDSTKSFWPYVGINGTTALSSITLGLVLTATLFAGPLYVAHLEGELPFQGNASQLRLEAGDILSWRNYVVGPISEEVVFRGCMVPLFLASGVTPTQCIFILPLFFGIAHAHHGYELYHRLRTTLVPARALTHVLLAFAFQFSYTSLFGWFATFLLLRTGNIMAPIVAHVFCNRMGVPDLPGAAAAGFPGRKKAIFAAYIAGMLGFSFLMFPATDPTLFGGAASLYRSV
ncbi:uncharacterized protein EV422DRAFT_78613 [Fimicolochytrium jonesii]|uniref:uncharacterized protein n=1 Tax=Fimicolochytrium jonesii TaxID=1396493 RepID=UPI0022FEA109|nr:uncharacterized protein EV422DRAFT_78613 [Fimicolochytrium jonesii]KAI8820102.1 hypothetical protein EV422DRAFT_78613 [Fimicolochytrium jonesii]